MKQAVIYDLEFTTWEGAAAREWSGENEHREVVQIGAIKIDWPSGKVIEELNILVKPVINPQLSNYFQDLTGVTQEQVDRDGIGFEEALNRFAAFCGMAVTGSYGNDNHVLVENILLLKLSPRPLDRMDFVNLFPAIFAADPATASVNSGRLWSHFNLEKPGDAQEHDALFDCYSILAALKHLNSKGFGIPFDY